MIVVHPNDFSTRFLHLIYEDIEDVLFFDSIRQKEQIVEAIKAAPKDEFILLLGHGTPYGLLGGIIGDEEAELLRDRPNLVCIWCYASTFARRHHLKGFFCGMFISEWYEAADMGVETGIDGIDELCWNFAGMFGDLLRAGDPLEAIAGDLMKAGDMNSELARFNLSRLTYRKTGMEPLPVEEDYWGYDDSLKEDAPMIVMRGIDAIHREIDRIMWEDGTSINFDEATYSVAKECFRLLLNRQPQMPGTDGPSVKELVSCLSQAGICCIKDANGLFRNRSYTVRMPGADYTLRAIKGIEGTCLELGAHLEYHVAIHTCPEGFLSTLNHFHDDIRPLIRPMLEDYCTEVRKRMMIDQIRKTAGKAR